MRLIIAALGEGSMVAKGRSSIAGQFFAVAIFMPSSYPDPFEKPQFLHRSDRQSQRQSWLNASHDLTALWAIPIDLGDLGKFKPI
jgi:hypothetical protein